MSTQTTNRAQNARGSGDQLRAQLVAAAGQLLTDPQRVALPSLRAVARACDVSPAAVYLHFDSVQALIRAVLASQIESLNGAMSAAGPELAEMAVAYVTWGMSHPGGYQLLFESADELGVEHDAHDPAGAEMIRTIAARIGEVPTQRLWTALHGIVSLRIHKPDMEWPMDAATAAREAYARAL